MKGAASKRPPGSDGAAAVKSEAVVPIAAIRSRLPANDTDPQRAVLALVDDLGALAAELYMQGILTTEDRSADKIGTTPLNNTSDGNVQGKDD